MKISIVKSAIALFSVVAFSAATADVGVYVAGESNPQSSASGTFFGQTTLVYGSGSGISLTCNLELTGRVDANAARDGGTITVTGGQVTSPGGIGGIPCLAVVLGDFPWVSEEVTEAELGTLSSVNEDVRVHFNDQVYVNLCGSNLSVSTTFNNNGSSVNSAPSTFSFVNEPISGGVPCRLDGTLTVVGSDIDALGGLAPY